MRLGRERLVQATGRLVLLSWEETRPRAIEKAYGWPFRSAEAYQAWLCGCHEACAREILKQTTKVCGEGDVLHLCVYV